MTQKLKTPTPAQPDFLKARLEVVNIIDVTGCTLSKAGSRLKLQVAKSIQLWEGSSFMACPRLCFNSILTMISDVV